MAALAWRRDVLEERFWQDLPRWAGQEASGGRLHSQRAVAFRLSRALSRRVFVELVLD